MGVESYLVCEECKEYIDLHKSRGFLETFFCKKAPPAGIESDIKFNNYWDARGVWFSGQHQGHKLKWMSDADDSWWSEHLNLKQVWPHYDDLKRRSGEQA